MALFLLYRIGRNTSNQDRDRAPVALVEASSREEAAALSPFDDPRSPRFCLLAKRVTVWENQRIEAIPASKAPRADVRHVREGDLWT